MEAAFSDAVLYAAVPVTIVTIPERGIIPIRWSYKGESTSGSFVTFLAVSLHQSEQEKTVREGIDCVLRDASRRGKPSCEWRDGRRRVEWRDERKAHNQKVICCTIHQPPSCSGCFIDFSSSFIAECSTTVDGIQSADGAVAKDVFDECDFRPKYKFFEEVRDSRKDRFLILKLRQSPGVRRRQLMGLSEPGGGECRTDAADAVGDSQA